MSLPQKSLKMSNCILKIEGLSKTFRSHWVYKPIHALHNVSLEIERGESFGFLGANGAGKTTTIKCILGLINKTHGEIFFNGKKLSATTAHAGIGFLPEQPYFYEHLSVFETLDFFARLYGIRGAERKKRVLATLERVGLSSRIKTNVRALSKGLQQRLGFAQAIINRPELLLLDEPFSGLDPIGRKEMRGMINELHDHGTTIFMSSHILPDVEDLCTRISIMKNGGIKKIFQLADVPNLFGETYEIIVRDLENNSGIFTRLSNSATSVSTKKCSANTQPCFHFNNYEEALRALELITAEKKQLYSFESIRPNLEQIFVQVTSESNE